MLYFGKFSPVHSCGKKFLFPKWLVDLSDVGKVVPYEDELIPYMGLARNVNVLFKNT